MMSWISKLLPFLKYWRWGGIFLLMAAFLLSFHLAKTRGEKLEVAEKAIEDGRHKIKQIEKAVQDERERQDFRNKQNKKIRMARSDRLDLAPSVRDAYELLRERRAGRK